MSEVATGLDAESLSDLFKNMERYGFPVSTLTPELSWNEDMTEFRFGFVRWVDGEKVHCGRVLSHWPSADAFWTEWERVTA